MDNPLTELEAWWEIAYDDGGAGTLLLDLRHRLEMEQYDGVETLSIDFETRDDEAAQAKWRLEIDRCLELDWQGPGEDFRWYGDHPLLYPHRDRWSRISYAKPFEDGLRVWGAVAKAHRDLIGKWYPLGRYFREDMVEKSYGILAEGPETLIGAYAGALLKIGVDIGQSTNDFLYATIENSPSASVVTWGDSYFIARSFKLTRLP